MKRTDGGVASRHSVHPPVAFPRLSLGVRAQPPWLLSDPECKPFGTKTRAAIEPKSQ